LFIDFKKAYDSVKRSEVSKAMEEFAVPKKLIRLVQMTLKNSKGNVRVRGEETEDFEIGTGLRQGDPLSTLLFNMILEKVLRDSHINRIGHILYRGHQVLAYADDVAIIARSVGEMQQVVDSIITAGAEMGLRINTKKTKVMRIGPEEKREINLGIAGERVEEVKEFTYLGTLLSSGGREELEIEARLTKGNKCAGSMNYLLRSKNLSRETKFRIYRTILRPTTLYCCETWVLNKNLQERLKAWERKILRRILGGKKVDEVYRVDRFNV
jgi:Reverse transcriptase (RNA-dependent DNA polymerase)